MRIPPGVFRPGRRTLLWVVSGAAAALAGALAFAAAEPGAEPRPVTVDEAQRMALARFRVYETSPAEVTVRVPSGDGTVLVRGTVDYRKHRAVGSYVLDGTAGAGAGRDRGLVAWDLGGLALAPGTRGAAPVQPAAVAAAVREPGIAWTPRHYTSDPLDTALRLSLSLAADRPDNAQLLTQSGPMWLRNERIDGRDHGVFSGPRPAPGKSVRLKSAQRPRARSPLTYWIDRDGGLRRVEMLTGSGQPLTVDFGAARLRTGVPGEPWKNH
ncbi:hypothetical protein H9Y04_09145 [Streptomyces sp. TRM66268-LWL]|uniref:DUF2092 domain-containing protein n=1 Tax=Streptomyces polyasparticus TaxID=2767826 RepID=A0ABR7SDQ8_9ACTN|nr:hypothetical protein [Streptomyces polyasparticus]MBC9712737.1 hypothetical protein [Streptomyces polyasparticus]